jgi:hypothetical protein
MSTAEAWRALLDALGEGENSGEAVCRQTDSTQVKPGGG